MNNILKLYGKIESRKTPQAYPIPTLPTKSEGVESKKIEKLINELEKIYNIWEKDTYFGGALISVHHNRTIAKSNRLKILLKEKGKSINDCIKGAKYDYEPLSNGKSKVKHIFTYFVELNTIKNTINILNICKKIIDNDYQGKIEKKDIDEINNSTKFKYEKEIKKFTFTNAVVDINYVDYFAIDERNIDNIEDEEIITLYETKINNDDFLRELNIHIDSTKKISNTTYLLKKNEIDSIINRAPFLVVMNVSNMLDIEPYYKEQAKKEVLLIPSPKDEPIIGVIDTLFYEDVYFHEWVDYKCYIDDNIPKNQDDYHHGTCVSSIIVDGPSFNKNLEDHCGRFRVRHFGVSLAKKFSSFTILKSIRRAVSENPDIKVWNLSLGAKKEIEKNFISIEATEIDKIQNDYDVIFIISGTNKDDDTNKDMRIGAPADSINSIVVNSVKMNGESASYTRTGPVLSFFCKPDVSYYGGDKNELIRVCSPTGENFVRGTSFATPWIARKVAYLIYKLGMTREMAKALIIDSAASWKTIINNIYKKGYGVVPIDINEIISTPNDEIKFMIYGDIKEYETYTYGLPVPIVDNFQPFYAKATLVYFPYCERNQGVDYTLTELDIHFGRMKNEKNIVAINKNIQSEEGEYLYEEEARKLFRKWDNVKHIGEELKDRRKPKKAYGIGLWGISIKCKERLDKKKGEGMHYGIIITLKEMNGKNRINEFKNLCLSRGWLVTELDVKNQIEIYNKLEDEIELE
ncbi:MAG: S8 family peptidase [Eubacteriales bacterium]|nr:S8 family peptidase [Eubacteriales bacterium]